LSRDVVLARRAGVVDAWASYGHHSDKPDLYAELKKITFWGPDDVTLEEQLQQEAMQMEPSFTLKSFTELAAICGLSPNQ
jgi:phosphoglycolate phosphatase